MRMANHFAARGRRSREHDVQDETGPNKDERGKTLLLTFNRIELEFRCSKNLRELENKTNLTLTGHCTSILTAHTDDFSDEKRSGADFYFEAGQLALL